MAERSDAPLANETGAGAPPNDDPGALSGAPAGQVDGGTDAEAAGDAPSGLPEGVEDSKPLGGIEDADPEGEGDTPRGEEAQPGLQQGEPDVSG